MDTPAVPHCVIVCSRCRDDRTREPGAAFLLPRLAEALDPAAFRIETVDCMAACERPIAVAFRAAGKTTYMFGDIDAAGDAQPLADFARLYASLADGWCNEGQRPAGLRGKTLARIPPDRMCTQ